MEILIINDASTDGTFSICSRWAHRFPFIKIIETPGLGPSSARNRGIEQASGEFIVFCDADDTYFPGAFRELLSILDSDPECDIAIGGMSESLETGNVRRHHVKTLGGTQALIATLYQKKHFHNSPCAKMYRRRVFHGIPLFRDGMRFEDLEITPRLYLNTHKIAVTSAPVYYYRPHEQSFMHTWSQSRFHALDATQLILEYVAEHCPQAVDAARSRRFSANFYILRNYRLHKNDAITENCINLLHEEAAAVLFNPRTRLKNKLGAVAALFGKTLLRLLR